MNVKENPLNAASINTHIPTLQSRGVEVRFDAVVAEPVVIPDDNLRAKIEEALGKASGTTITTVDMESLTELRASNANISDLTGLEYATNLTDLRLNNNSISDISAVAGLNNLTVLYLARNSISDGSPVEELTQLTRLGLSINAISDISPLARLNNLTELGLRGNSISDISAVAGLTNLTGLWLSDNSISDLSPLIANTGLGSGDLVDVSENPLNAVSINTHIPALRSRGVTVEAEDLKPTTSEYTLTMPAGISLIHLPLKVTAVNRSPRNY